MFQITVEKKGKEVVYKIPCLGCREMIARKSLPPVFKCPKCGHQHHAWHVDDDGHVHGGGR